MKKLKVLIGCEFSGTVRDEFTKLGHFAVSCDILPTEKPGSHIQGDIMDVLGMGWDLAIFHPPCTRLANSGVRWLNERNLWGEMEEGARFFKALLDCDIPHIAVENPIPHKYGLEIIGRKYDQVVQPWWFGHGEQKATCLWLKNLPKLVATDIVSGREQSIWKMSPGADRGKERSRTFKGLAEAMATQWSTYLNELT